MEEVPDFNLQNYSEIDPLDNEAMDPVDVEEDVEATVEAVMDNLVNTPGECEDVRQFAQMVLSSERTNQSIHGFMRESMGAFEKINASLQMISDRLSSTDDYDQAFVPNPTSMQQEFQMEADTNYMSPSLESFDTTRMSNVTGRNTNKRSQATMRQPSWRQSTICQPTNNPSMQQPTMQRQEIPQPQTTPRYILQNRLEPTLTPLQQGRRQQQPRCQSTRYSTIPIIPQASINVPYDIYSRQP